MADCRRVISRRRSPSTRPGEVSDQPAGGGPPGELMPVGKLEFAQDRGDVGLDRLHRDEQLLGDLFVRVAARDQPHDLALALGQAVEFLVDRWYVGRGEGIENEAGKPRREDGVAVGNPAYRLDQLRP